MPGLVDRRSLVAAGAGLLLPVVGGCTTRSAGARPSDPVAPTERPTPSPTASATQRLTPTPTPTPRGLAVADLEAALVAYLEGRTGRYRLAVHDRRSGVVLHHDSGVAETLSTIKVLIVMALVRNAVTAGRWLSDDEDALATAMLQRSDNDATNVVLARLGDPPVDAEIETLRLTSTSFRPGEEWWGYSTTVPEDLLMVVDALADGTTGLGEKAEEYVLTLMEGVAETQRWGVASPPLPGNVVVRTKNGWGPTATGYRVNSVGHVVGDGRDHTMAVLGNSPLGRSYGAATVSTLTTMVHEALAERLV